MAGVGGGAFAGILIANNIGRATKAIAAAKTAWRAVDGLTLSEERVEGVVAATTGAERPKLSGLVGGVPVEVIVATDLVHCATTVVTAKPPKGVDATLGLYPSPGGALSKLRDWLRNDVVVGDAELDAAFLITAKPSSAAAQLLMPGKTREHLARLLGSIAAFEYERERVRVVLTRVELDVEVLNTAVALAVEAAGWS